MLRHTKSYLITVILFFFSSLIQLGGCSSPPPKGQPSRIPLADTSLNRLTTDHPEPNMSLTQDFIIPENAGPEDYVRMVLERNPALQAARYGVERAEARIPQVTALDDPMLEVAPLGDMAETAAGMVGVMTGVSQKLPFPGKLRHSGLAAEQETGVAKSELEMTRLNLINETRRAYWSYYYTTRAMELTAESRELLAEFQQIAESQYRVGLANQQDVLRASVELSSLDNELITWEQQQTTAAAMLNSLLARPVTAALPKPPGADSEQITLKLNWLLAQAEQANPELQRIRQQIAAEQEKLEVARLQRWPDLTVSYNYSFVEEEGMAPSPSGKDQWWIGFGVNVPVWSRKYDAAEREARAGIHQGSAELQDARNRLAFRVQDAYVRLDTQQRLVTLLHDVSIPQAQQTLEVSTSSYSSGKVDFLTLVSNWRQVLDFKLAYQQSLAELERSFAELQQTVGRDLTRHSDSITP